jgi:hypothetical protein
MNKFVIKKKQNVEHTPIASDVNVINNGDTLSKTSHTELNLDDLPLDPRLRKKFSEYHPNDRDKV